MLFRSNRNSKEKILEFLDVSIAARFLFDQSEIVKQDFYVEFSSDCSKRLKRFQAL